MTYPDALKLNAWAGVAVFAAFASRLLLRDPELGGLSRVAAALLPRLPGLLHVRALWRWIQALDEMQRKLQSEAVCFATLACC